MTAVEPIPSRIMPESNPSVDAAIIDLLRSPQTIRDRAAQLFALGVDDRLMAFQLDLDRLDAVVDVVEQTTRHNYPTLEIPLHSRWRHFPQSRLERLFTALDGVERAKAQIDLVIPSVLLDAGAGDRWRYVDQAGRTWQRSQGLAVASLELFSQGLLSHKGKLQTDARGLQQITLEQLARAFQVSEINPLVGLEGRLALLHRLGDVLMTQPAIFGEAARLGNLLDGWMGQAATPPTLSAETILQTVLVTLGAVWPSRQVLAGVNLGDVWTHPQLSPLCADAQSTYIPFHKLSQWLTYSLLEPLQSLGLRITDVDRLTGLAEYRNGGLFLDLGVLCLRDAAIVQSSQLPGATVMVEWRGLTIHLLDQVADRLRQRWQMDATQLPLAKVLQGGTWSAGRMIAAKLRSDGGPPIRLKSDGTVF
ncbi:DUF1688 family protein [filamentous cyanobacterium LEGE 11480]|uniref:DUF1688 family protein n=2 Tax=Romeriopsis TaxID=2992131 RepID=A0A928Z3Y6_9CYAN|nr:DUF1688 family protein [Romeriopsis navalis LEGE 11480]